MRTLPGSLQVSTILVWQHVYCIMCRFYRLHLSPPVVNDELLSLACVAPPLKKLPLPYKY